MGIGFVSSLTPSASAADSSGTVISGVFVEPILTYEVGSTDVNYPSPLSNSTGSSNGFGLGGRLGLHLKEIFVVGLDARYSLPNYTDSSVDYDASAVSTNWGPVVGVQMPDVGLRIWASYLLGGSLNPDRSGSFDVNFQDLTGYRLGAGFRLASLSLNLEFQNVKYNQANLESVGPFSLGTTFESVELKNTSWIASVSFPLEL